MYDACMRRLVDACDQQSAAEVIRSDLLQVVKECVQPRAAWRESRPDLPCGGERSCAAVRVAGTSLCV